MSEGPDVAGNADPSRREPDRREQREAEAARHDLLHETIRARNTVVTAIAIATLLILVAIGYQRCTDPWWRCKRLADGDIGPSEHELRAWDELECNEWPGI